MSAHHTDRLTAPQPQRAEGGGIGLVGLIAIVISSSIGSGVFALSTDISSQAAPGPALLAWLITGIGFMALARTFGRLSLVRPDLNGIVAYAQEGFGPFAGFISGWGYWLSIWIGNVAFGVMFVTAIGYFYPPFAGALTPTGVAVISLLNWGMIWLVNRGVEEASIVNAIVMACKLIPIFVFIVTMALLFDGRLFTADFWGTLAGNLTASAHAGGLGSVSEQIVGCLVVMMWVFVGMEGATVLGHRARRKADVSRATILGTFALVLIYVAASILPYGFMTRAQIAALDAPSMIYLFRAAAGDAGGAFIAVGLIVSILGAWLSYTILASEAMQSMAEMHLLPHLFARKNRHGAPVASLIATGTMIQALTLTMLLAERAYEFAYSLCTMVIMPAWALAAAYMIVCSLRERTPGRLIDASVAAIAVVFLAAATVIAGIDMLILSSLAYVPGIILYAIARRRFELPIMQTKFEYVLGALILLALISVF